MAPRPKHPHKEIEKAIQYAEENGWHYVKSGDSAHAWGRLRCFLSSREGCQMSIWSTPKNPENHARQIIRCIGGCPHKEDK